MSVAATISDIALLRRYADDRDETAFAEIVSRYAGMVYAACYRVLQDKQLAEDVTQETFLRLMRKPAHVSLSLGGWLHKAATQLAIDMSRSESPAGVASAPTARITLSSLRTRRAGRRSLRRSTAP